MNQQQRDALLLEAKLKLAEHWKCEAEDLRLVKANDVLHVYRRRTGFPFGKDWPVLPEAAIYEIPGEELLEITCLDTPDQVTYRRLYIVQGV